LPTRLFHWSLVMLIALQYATGQFHVLDMRWHFWFGYATLALISFRMLWGLFGSQTSRFAHFVRGPGAVLRYVRSQLSKNPQVNIGHSPLGGWSVLALLLCIGMQTVTGLFASDEIDTDGPYAALVSARTVKLMTRLHNWNQNLLLVLIALHIVAVLLYLLLKHENLITPMITGRKRDAAANEPQFASAWLALGLLVLCATLVGALVWWFGA
jgi:cytochrome b